LHIIVTSDNPLPIDFEKSLDVESINIMANVGNKSTKGRYKGHPSTYSMVSIIVENEYTTLEKLFNQLESLGLASDEPVVYIHTSSNENTCYLDSQTLKLLSKYNCELDVYSEMI
jgi:hypothetical protein